MNLETKIRQSISKGTLRRPGETFQGVTKARIMEVLKALDRGGNDQVDAVFALLDNQNPSWFGEAASAGFKFCHGATTAHIGVHVGVLQRNSGKLDREGRDYWCKPLWEPGAMLRVYFEPEKRMYLDGWPVAKSPNCAYRLSDSFIEILKSSDNEWKMKLALWNSKDATRQRLEMQAQLAAKAKASVDSSHEILIKACCEEYAARFLQGYELIYVDATDGDRVDADDEARLAKAGLEIRLEDSMPDALFWHPKSNWLWVVEAVTSDGEVDMHKIEGLQKLATRSGKAGIGFTTAFMSWKDAAARQGKYKNIAPDTYIWIHEDGSKQFKVESFR